jgi:ubiquinone/menaquinone biosynthesis C-methylase UbiE
MRIVTFEDARDIYLKMAQRGLSFSLSKLTFNQVKRTKSSFNAVHFDSSNWWIIPEVKQRWNELITGSKDVTYEEFVSRNFFQGYPSLQMVSIGSGVCSHELKLAELNPHYDIICVDFSEHLLAKAKEVADEKQLKNIRFLSKDIHEYEFPAHSIDVVFFHQSLHHFKEMDTFVKKKVVDKLKATGYLMMNEYVGVNRLQYAKEQIRAINKCLSLVPNAQRLLYKTDLVKNRYYGSGLLRMIIADPSECVESENIRPVIHKYFEPIFEKSFGGNLLMPVLKDISHHFINARVDQEKQMILNRLFECEDQYLSSHPSDFVFGIYRKRM